MKTAHIIKVDVQIFTNNDNYYRASTTTNYIIHREMK